MILFFPPLSTAKKCWLNYIWGTPPPATAVSQNYSLTWLLLSDKIFSITPFQYTEMKKKQS